MWGEEHRGAAGLGGGGGRGGQSWVRAGAARGSSLPAGRGRPRGSVWSECAGRPAHLQRRAWKRAARPAVSPGRTLAAARPPESRLPGMTVGRQVVVASPPRFALQPALSHWGGAGGGGQRHIRAHREFCLSWDPPFLLLLEIAKPGQGPKGGVPQPLLRVSPPPPTQSSARTGLSRSRCVARCCGRSPPPRPGRRPPPPPPTLSEPNSPK